MTLLKSKRNVFELEDPSPTLPQVLLSVRNFSCRTFPNLHCGYKLDKGSVMSSDIEMPFHMPSKECFTLGYIQPHSPLRLVRNATDDMTVLWSKHEMFLYKSARFDSPVTMQIIFEIKQVLLSAGCVVCIDSNSLVHTIPLKFKSKTIKIPFKPKAQGIIYSTQIDQDIAVSLLIEEEVLYISIHKINTEFELIRKWKVNGEGFLVDDHNNLFMRASKITLRKVSQKVFKKELTEDENNLIILFTFDKLTTYGQVINLKDKEFEIELIKLFTSPTEIQDFQIVNEKVAYLLLGLKTGTLIVLNLENEVLEAKIMHLNAAIEKMEVTNDGLIYTDGVKMWLAENIYSENDLSFKQIFNSQPHHFVKHGNKVLCITYNNLIYNFCIESDDVFTTRDHTEDDFIPIPRDLTSSKMIVMEIMNVVNRNEEILKKIKLENNFTTALALSTKKAILDQHITFTTYVYEKYKDVLKEHDGFLLTRDLKEYFEPKTWILLIEMRVSSEFRQKFNEIASCLGSNMQLHITLAIEDIVQTTTIPLHKKMHDNFRSLIPVKNEKSSQISVTLRIISPISGPFDAKQLFWTILVSKDVILKSEHFIKADQYVFNDKVISYHCTRKEMSKVIWEFAKRNHGLYDFEEAQQKIAPKDWTCYIKLPENHQEKLSDKNLYAKTLNCKISEILSKKFGSSDFLKSHSIVYLAVLDNKVAFQLKEDPEMVLKISGLRVDIVFDMRTFFSKLFYSGSSERELVEQVEYTRIENLHRQLRNLLAEVNPDETAILTVAEQFHKFTLGTLPL